MSSKQAAGPRGEEATAGASASAVAGTRDPRDEETSAAAGTALPKPAARAATHEPRTGKGPDNPTPYAGK